MAGGEDLGDALLGFVEGDDDRGRPGGKDGVEVLGERALVVGDGVFYELRAGWLGNGDANSGCGVGHGCLPLGDYREFGSGQGKRQGRGNASRRSG